jgi:hypothetical protein
VQAWYIERVRVRCFYHVKIIDQSQDMIDLMLM